jgi:cyclase
MRTVYLRAALAMAALVAAPSLAQAQQVEVEQLAERVYMLSGTGGNIGVSVGEDGVVLIDDQYAPATPAILNAVATISDRPVRFVINTHWHGDHTGGNENMGDLGALIVAHENVRQRMSTEQVIEAFGRTVPPSPDGALPVITFTESLTLHWNGDALEVIHVDPAHTDTDSIVRFEQANVIHMGDTFFSASYPFIDVSSGGNLTGMIAACDRGLGLADGETRFIPGHGPSSDRAGLQAYREMLETVRWRVQGMIDGGQTRDQVVAAKPTAEFDEQWGNGFLSPDMWVGIVYDSLTR